MTDTYEPPYEDWKNIFRTNLLLRAQTEKRISRELITSVRRELVACADQYRAEIVDVARRCGIDGLVPDITAPGGEVPIVMAGHQPVVFHPGLLCKAQALSRFAEESNAFGVNVIIDTDEGDGGVLVWPRVSSGSLEIRRASIAHSESPLYMDQRVLPADEVSRVFEGIVTDLGHSGLDTEARYVQLVGELYRRLEGESISLAHSVVKWVVAGLRTFEVPLSAIVRATGLGNVLREFVLDGIRLAGVYNRTLDAYRTEHRIHNPANPFPNMKQVDSQTELPLWYIKSGVRAPVFVQSESPHVQEAEGFLASRGSITTMLLRGMCSDLFIHGLGGGKYDRFVDQLAQAYLGVELPRYVVASRTSYLFPEKVAELTHSIRVSSQVKDMISKTEQFLGRGIFSAEEEGQLHRLSQERDQLRAALQGVTNPADKSATAHRLNAANRQVRELIETGTLRTHIVNAAKNEASLVRWSFREFPFFLYKLPRSA